LFPGREFSAHRNGGRKDADRPTSGTGTESNAGRSTQRVGRRRASVHTISATGKAPTALPQAQARNRTQGGQRNALAAGGPRCTPHSAAGKAPTALPGPCKQKTRSEERVLRVTESAGSDQLFQFRQDLEQVAHQAVVGHLED